MHNIMERPSIYHLNSFNGSNPGLYGGYSTKQKCYDEAHYEFYAEASNYVQFVHNQRNETRFRWTPEYPHNSQIDLSFHNLQQIQNYNSLKTNTKYEYEYNQPTKNKRPTNNQRHTNKIAQSQSNMNINMNHQDQPQHTTNIRNNKKIDRNKFPTFTNASMLNSLADYNLMAMDDKMSMLNIDYSRNDLKNMSLDSLYLKKKNSSPPRDEFAAYRLTEADTQIIKSKSENSSPLNSAQTRSKSRHHHHHRAKRNNRNKNKNGDTIKKSQSNLSSTKNNNPENQDSLSAFDFSNTDEFWEDDICINSELIEVDKLMGSSSSSNEGSSNDSSPPTIKFVSVSCDSLNGILMMDAKFDLKESIIKDKLYEDILDFKDNLTIN